MHETHESQQKITLVGPTHPFGGGIAQHTTRLALELEALDCAVTVESWKAQYPRFMYKGPERVPGDAPEIGLPKRVVQKLAWYSPLSWFLAGWRSRKEDTIAFSVPTPFHIFPYTVIRLGLHPRVRTIGIVHNVLPHEPSPIDRLFMSMLLKQFDLVVVHGPSEKDQARRLGVPEERISQKTLVSPWQDLSNLGLGRKQKPESLTALFFGTIRHYKGLDLLISAVAEIASINLIVAGEFWETREQYANQIATLGLENRVELRPGYVPREDFDQLFSEADFLVLPYRSGTGSFMTDLAFAFGLPVLASSAGSISEKVQHDQNGLIFEADNLRALVTALRFAASPGKVDSWKQKVLKEGKTNQAAWKTYCEEFVFPIESRVQ